MKLRATCLSLKLVKKDQGSRGCRAGSTQTRKGLAAQATTGFLFFVCLFFPAEATMAFESRGDTGKVSDESVSRLQDTPKLGIQGCYPSWVSQHSLCSFPLLPPNPSLITSRPNNSSGASLRADLPCLSQYQAPLSPANLDQVTLPTNLQWQPAHSSDSPSVVLRPPATASPEECVSNADAWVPPTRLLYQISAEEPIFLLNLLPLYAHSSETHCSLIATSVRMRFIKPPCWNHAGGVGEIQR